MKIKILILTIFSALLLGLPVYANDDHKKGDDAVLAQKEAKVKRDNFYGNMESKIKFKKTDINAVKDAGYSPFFSMMMLFIAREAAVPVADLIKMRSEGKCWGDMCKALGLDYAAIADKFETAIAANNIKFPMTSGKEQEADITYSSEGGR